FLRDPGVNGAEDFLQQQAGVLSRKNVSRKKEDRRHPDYRRRPVFQNAASLPLFNAFDHPLRKLTVGCPRGRMVRLMSHSVTTKRLDDEDSAPLDNLRDVTRRVV